MSNGSIELGAVLRRHHRATGVVLRVEDESPRWAPRLRARSPLRDAHLTGRRGVALLPVRADAQRTERHRAVVCVTTG
jgi:hypothetical protein